MPDNYSVKVFDGEPVFFRAADLTEEGVERRTMLPLFALTDASGVPMSDANPLAVVLADARAPFGIAIELLSEAAVTGDWIAWKGSQGFLSMEADDWDGATAQLEWRLGDAYAVHPVAGTAFTENGFISEVPLADGEVRVAVAGAGSNTLITAHIQRTR